MTIIEFLSKWYSTITTFENDVDQFHHLKLFDIAIGLNCDDWVGTRRQVWRMCKSIYLLMFLIHCTKLQNAIRDEEENSAYTQQVYIVFFVYVTNAAVIYAIKINRKEQDAIRRFVNKRKLRRFDERALKIRTRSFRINTVISLLPLLLTTFDIPMLLISGTLFNAEYALDVQLGEDWELISKLIMAGSLIFLTVFIFITLFTFVYMNSLLSGVIAEAEILGDHFSGLEFRVAAKNPMNQGATSALTTKETYLDLSSWRDELRICVGLQQDFFECILSLKKVSRNISFVQYYVSFLLIADCIMLAMNGINNIFDIGFMFFGLFFVSQCCLMCYWLERLEDENERIGFLAYSLPWPMNLNFSPGNIELSKEIRAMILFVIQRANENINFSCGGFFPITVERFADIMRMTYALLMAMLEMND